MTSILGFRRRRPPGPPLREMLQEIPEVTQPSVVHRTHGEMVADKVDILVRARNRVVDLQGELGRAEIAWRQAEVELVQAIKDLGIRPETIDDLLQRGRAIEGQPSPKD